MFLRMRRSGPRSEKPFPHPSFIRKPDSQFPKFCTGVRFERPSAVARRFPMMKSCWFSEGQKSGSCDKSSLPSASQNRTHSVSVGRFAIPVRQAFPYPFTDSLMTVAPAFVATCSVLSVDPLSTTITPVTWWDSKLEITAEIVSSSFRAGMMAVILGRPDTKLMSSKGEVYSSSLSWEAMLFPTLYVPSTTSPATFTGSFTSVQELKSNAAAIRVREMKNFICLSLERVNFILTILNDLILFKGVL